jgi:hypothetical protein
MKSKVYASQYYRQYIGLTIGQRQLIYVNGFHSSYFDLEQTFDSLRAARGVPTRDPSRWRANFVGMCDGYTGFFGVLYDPATGAFEHFSFNGIA